MGCVFVFHSLPSVRTLLSAVAGPRKALLPSPDTASSTRPEPTLTLRWSMDSQSLATGGCSGKGRLAWACSICSGLLVLLSMTDLTENERRCPVWQGGARAKAYLHGGDIRVRWSLTVMLTADSGFWLADILLGAVESGVRHGDDLGMRSWRGIVG